MNIFDCAIAMEEEAREFYEKLAERSAVPELKKLFRILAEAEQEHHNALAALKENNKNAGIQFAVLEDAACHFKPLLALRDVTGKVPRNDIDAYQQIITEEEDSIRLYEDLASREADAEVRRILLMIAAEERKHLSIVENIYSFVESPKNFLAWGEFSNLSGYGSE